MQKETSFPKFATFFAWPVSELDAIIFNFSFYINITIVGNEDKFCSLLSQATGEILILRTDLRDERMVFGDYRVFGYSIFYLYKGSFIIFEVPF